MNTQFLNCLLSKFLSNENPIEFSKQNIFFCFKIEIFVS